VDGARGADGESYVAPPAFAPPAQRVAPLNETAVLGHTNYPNGPYAPPPAPYAVRSPPVQRPRHPRRRASVLISLGVITALITIGTVVFAGPGTRHARSLTLPDTVDHYTRVTTLTGARVRSLFAASGATFGAIGTHDLDRALVGVYANVGDSVPDLLFIGFTAHYSPAIGSQLHARPSGAVAEAVLAGAGATTGAKPVDAGPMGGALRCATVAMDGEDAAVGVWADTDTLGIVLIVQSYLSSNTTVPSTAETGSVTRDFRAAAEH
jgi:hypothetical protein